MAATQHCPLKETHGGKFSVSQLVAGSPNLASTAGILAVSQTPLIAQAGLGTYLSPHWPREGQRLPVVTRESELLLTWKSPRREWLSGL